jgi:hypothetical protein
MWIFGYGSLIYAEGLNRRGLIKQYKEKDLIETTLIGYKRSYNADIIEQHMRFFGLEQNIKYNTNGTLFELIDEDFNEFSISEGLNYKNSIYWLKNIYNDLIIKPKNTQLVLTCMTINPTFKSPVPEYYYKIIQEALKVRSKEFVEIFNKTNYDYLPKE